MQISGVGQLALCALEARFCLPESVSLVETQNDIAEGEL